MNPIILVGRADCWKEDVENLKKLTLDFDVMAVGMECLYVKDIKFFVTYHIQDIVPYLNRRNSLDLNLDFKVISSKNDSRVDIVEEYGTRRSEGIKLGRKEKEPTGSSAMLGSIAAIHLGYTKVILCGCPMEGKNKDGFQPYDHFQKGWVHKRELLCNYVRSMSGWTRNFLGEPTIEWLGLNM